MPKQKGFSPLLVILGIVVILGIAGGVYYLGALRNKPQTHNAIITSQSPSPTPDETSNWKTYTNNTIGFTIKYPENWKLNISDYQDGVIGIRIDHPDSPSAAYYGTLPSIGILVDKLDLTIGYQNNAVIDGVNAFRRSAPSGMQVASEGIEFKKGDYRFDINLQYEDDKMAKQGGQELGIYNKQAVSIYNTMLSTFKFLDQNQMDTSSWKTYTSKYGFTLKYPANFHPQEYNVGSNNDQMYTSVRFTKDAINQPIIDIGLAATSLSPEEWIKSKDLCPLWTNKQSCSVFRTGPIPNSIQFDSLGRHYASIDTFVKMNQVLLFDISMDATTPDTAIPALNSQVYDQILSTFKFTQ